MYFNSLLSNGTVPESRFINSPLKNASEQKSTFFFSLSQYNREKQIKNGGLMFQRKKPRIKLIQKKKAPDENLKRIKVTLL